MASTAENNTIGGVYTKTIVASPIVNWILQAKLIDDQHTNAVLIGDHLVHVKQLEARGYLRHVVAKNDFHGRIRAASVFHTHPESSADEGGMQLDPNEKRPAPHMIVLVLDSDELIFLSLLSNQDGTHSFRCKTLPLPAFDRALFKLGEHLSVDPYSRTIAIAAMERELFICSVTSHIPETAFANDLEDWPPVSTRRSFKVGGVIHNMCFLTPQVGDEDHVVLLLIVIESNRKKAIWFDWYHSTGLGGAQLRPGQAVDDSISMSNLLIPLKDASFLLSKGQEIIHWRNLLSGSADSNIIPIDDADMNNSGISPAKPVWASWAQPCRNPTSRRARNDVYLAREDGLVYLLSTDGKDLVEISLAGNVECHVGTAFASLGDESDPDILAVGGDLSNGRLVTIGSWSDSSMGWRETMNMNEIQLLPNWTSTLDMVPSNLGAKPFIQAKHRHGIYVTAGREPHGSVVELQRGCELKIAASFNPDGLTSVTNVWALPEPFSQSTVILLSRPTTTQILTFSFDADVVEVNGGLVFDTFQTTLVAGITSYHHLVQVTPRKVCIASTLQSQLEEVIHISQEDGTEILAAAVVTEVDVVILAQRNGDAYNICCLSVALEDMDNSLGGNVRSGPTIVQPIDSRPLCVTAISVDSCVIVATTTVDNRISIIVMTDNGAALYFDNLPTVAEESMGVCDQILILQPSNQYGSVTELLVVCGLRDGRIITYRVDSGRQPRIKSRHEMIFSTSTVKLTQLGTDNKSAVATSGTDFCLLEWAGGTSELSSIESIWASDPLKPEFNQSGVVACATMPPVCFSSSSSAVTLMVVCENGMLLSTLDRLATVIPRRISVSGTPNRLIYSEELRCLVCSSERSIIFPPRGSSAAKRQRWPVIDIISLKHAAPSYSHVLQPGDQVYALLSWSYRSVEDKMYSCILIGGSYRKRNGVRRGRVSFLQPKLSRNRQIVGLYSEPHHIKFEHEVFALGQYDAMTIIACSGQFVYLYQFEVSVMKWNQLCRRFPLASPGVCISTQEAPQQPRSITISTARDSAVVLKLQQVATEVGSDHSYKLIAVSMAPTAESSQSHLTITGDEMESSDTSLGNITLLSTKDARLIGLQHHIADSNDPAAGILARSRDAKVLFTCTLLSSLRRIKKSSCHLRKGSPPHGILNCRVIGSTTDGAIIGIALLERQTWQRLVWFQRLCGWSESSAPYEQLGQPSDTGIAAGMGSTMPARLSDSNASMIPPSYPKEAEDDRVNGDLISRFANEEGSEAIKKVIRGLGRRDDYIGRWMRNHEQEEIQAVDEMTEMIKRLNNWI